MTPAEFTDRVRRDLATVRERLPGFRLKARVCFQPYDRDNMPCGCALTVVVLATLPNVVAISSDEILGTDRCWRVGCVNGFDDHLDRFRAGDPDYDAGYACGQAARVLLEE